MTGISASPNNSKRERNRAMRRAVIVEIATRALLDHGYAATTMSAIADRVGGSKGTLWAHFADKEELFAAVVDDRIEKFADDLDGVLARQAFSVAALRDVCVRLCHRLLQEDSVLLLRLVMGEGGRFPEIARVFYSRGPERMVFALRDFFATRYEASEAIQLARLTIAAMIGYRSDFVMRPEAQDMITVEEHVDSFVRHLKLPCETRRER